MTTWTGKILNKIKNISLNRFSLSKNWKPYPFNKLSYGWKSLTANFDSLSPMENGPTITEKCKHCYIVNTTLYSILPTRQYCNLSFHLMSFKKKHEGIHWAFRIPSMPHTVRKIHNIFKNSKFNRYFNNWFIKYLMFSRVSIY